jgi:hypothetical protein
LMKNFSLELCTRLKIFEHLLLNFTNRLHVHDRNILLQYRDSTMRLRSMLGLPCTHSPSYINHPPPPLPSISHISRETSASS